MSTKKTTSTATAVALAAFRESAGDRRAKFVEDSAKLETAVRTAFTTRAKAFAKSKGIGPITVEDTVSLYYGGRYRSNIDAVEGVGFQWGPGMKFEATINIKLPTKMRARFNKELARLHEEHDVVERLPTKDGNTPAWRREWMRDLMAKNPDLARKIVAMVEEVTP